MSRERDRRRSKRIYVNQRCWFDTSDLTLYLRIHNASQEGLFLKTATPLPAGTHATLSWETPDKTKIVAKVEVMWSKPADLTLHTLSGMGIRFVEFIEGGEKFQSEIEDMERLSTDVLHMS